MFTVELAVFFYIYLAFITVFGVLVLTNLLHLVHTGTITLLSSIVTGIVVVFSFFIISSTWGYAQTIDWHTPITLWDNAWIGSLF